MILLLTIVSCDAGMHALRIHPLKFFLNLPPPPLTFEYLLRTMTQLAQKLSALGHGDSSVFYWLIGVTSYFLQRRNLSVCSF